MSALICLINLQVLCGLGEGRDDVSVLCSEERGEHQWKAANFLVDVDLYSCLRSLGESSSVL